MVNHNSILRKWGKLSSSQQSRVMKSLSRNQLSGIPEIDQELLSNSSSSIINLLGSQTGGRNLTKEELDMRDKGMMSPSKVAQILNESPAHQPFVPQPQTLSLLKDIQNKMNVLKQSKLNFENQLNECNDKFNKLSSAHTQTRTLLQNAENQNKELKNTLDKMKMSTTNFNGQLKDCTNKLNELTNKHTVTQTQLRNSETQNKELKNNLEKVGQTASTSHVAINNALKQLLAQ